MEIKIEIPDDKAQNLSVKANEELCTITKKYVENILDEASRLESSMRLSKSNPEITATIINNASSFYEKKYWFYKKKPISVFVHLGAFFSTLLLGFIFNLNKFTKPIDIVLFLVIFLVCIVLNSYIIFKEKSNE